MLTILCKSYAARNAPDCGCASCVMSYYLFIYLFNLKFNIVINKIILFLNMLLTDLLWS